VVVGEGRAGWELLWNGPDQLQLPVISRFFPCRREGKGSRSNFLLKYLIAELVCVRTFGPQDLQKT
jgi:hypothetical protein